MDTMDTTCWINNLVKIDLTSLEKCEMIDKTGWSNDFSWEEIKVLAKHMLFCQAQKGMIISREGAIESFMCLILEGTVKIMKEDFGRNKKLITSLATGAVFGEMSLIDGSSRSASIIANEDAILLVLTKDKFFYLMEETPRLGLKLVLKIAKSLSLRLRQTSGVLIDYLEK